MKSVDFVEKHGKIYVAEVDADRKRSTSQKPHTTMQKRGWSRTWCSITVLTGDRVDGELPREAPKEHDYTSVPRPDKIKAKHCCEQIMKQIGEHHVQATAKTSCSLFFFHSKPKHSTNDHFSRRHLNAIATVTHRWSKTRLWTLY